MSYRTKYPETSVDESHLSPCALAFSFLKDAEKVAGWVNFMAAGAPPPTALAEPLLGVGGLWATGRGETGSVGGKSSEPSRSAGPLSARLGSGLPVLSVSVCHLASEKGGDGKSGLLVLTL